MTIEQIGILLSLLVTILGWSITAYFQKQILERQIKADKEKQAEQFAHEKEMAEMLSQQRTKELGQQGLRQQRLEILPTAHDKMLEAFSWASHLNKRLLTSPNFNSMTEVQLQDAVSNLEFSPSQKEELLKADDKNEYYMEKKFWYDLDKTQKCADEYHNYLVGKKIFIESALFEKYILMDTLITETLNALRIGKQAHDTQMFFEVGDKLVTKGPGMIEEIERLIQEQLH